MNDSTDLLSFDGHHSYVEIPDTPALSVATTGALTVSAMIRPATLSFPVTEFGEDPENPYVHWMGKGTSGEQEWVFRIYSDEASVRRHRISFYLFNLAGGIGVGSHFQDELQPGIWIHVMGIADGNQTHIYRDGQLRDSDSYTGQIVPQRGAAPLRIGTRDLHSYFQGEIREVRVWNRALSPSEANAVHLSGDIPGGLVAEYRLTRGVAVDSVAGNDGRIFAATWIQQTT